MKKQIIVLLLMLNSAFVHAMLSLSFLSHDSLLTGLCLHIPHESELVSNLRTYKNTFEKLLQLDRDIEYRKTYIPETMQLFIPDLIFNDPNKLFLRYCYYQKFHNSERLMNLDVLKNAPVLFNKCLNARLYGCSAVGAAMLAPDTPLYVRYNFVQQLINLDFYPTSKDREIAELILYDEIMKNKRESEFKKKLIHLLHPDSAAHWHIFPQEIRRLIAWYLVEVIKTDNNYWLLPDGKKDLVVMY
jgi:hypothetical protein